MNKTVLILLLSFSVFTLTSCGSKENITKEEEKNISIKEELQEIDNIIAKPIGTSTIESLNEAEKTAIEKSMEFLASGDITLKQTVTPIEAQKIYMKKFPNTQIYKIEFEKKKGKFIYEIEGFKDNKEYEIKVDLKTGEIIEEKTKLSSDNQKKSELALANIEKIDKFVGKAISDVGEGTTLMEWTLKMKNGIPEIEIEMVNKGMKIEQVYNIETEELLKIKD
ncbi:MAG: PepSY domain-containing protein [Clostridiales bacterium]|nr:PepSY domain-containing protein [Clostridiales bacterium]